MSENFGRPYACVGRIWQGFKIKTSSSLIHCHMITADMMTILATKTAHGVAEHRKT